MLGKPRGRYGLDMLKSASLAICHEPAGTLPGYVALPQMLSLETLIGFVAAACTTLANLPQVIKAWRTRSTGDLSLKMLLMLVAGLSLWIGYGLMRGDLIIIFANIFSLGLILNLLVFKLKEIWGDRAPGASAPQSPAG